MKKSLTGILGLLLVAAMVAGCGTTAAPSSSSSAASASSSAASSMESSTESSGTEDMTESSSSAPMAEEPMPADGLKTGLAIDTHMRESKEATAEADGLGKAYSTMAAVLVDANGVITNCYIDAVITEVNFDATGKVTTDMEYMPKSKNELGTEYGMGAVSAIGKEWDQQAAAIAAYVVGKTADEVKNIAVTDQGKPADAELAGSVSIYTPSFLTLVEKAVNTASYQGAKVGDKLGMGTVTHITKSKDAGERDGQTQAYSFYGVTSVGADGKITSTVLDSTQGTVTFDATGKITSDTKAAVPTKNELGDEYGMKKASALGLEWNVQAANFAKYTVGKTPEEVQAIAVSEDGAIEDSELSAGVSIDIAYLQDVIAKAAANAK